MSYIKLEGECKDFADKSYDLEKQVLDFIEDMLSLPEVKYCDNAEAVAFNEFGTWQAISRLEVQKSFMFVRRAITACQKINDRS
jgi:hypothetical protein